MARLNSSQPASKSGRSGEMSEIGCLISNLGVERSCVEDQIEIPHTVIRNSDLNSRCRVAPPPRLETLQLPTKLDRRVSYVPIISSPLKPSFSESPVSGNQGNGNRVDTSPIDSTPPAEVQSLGAKITPAFPRPKRKGSGNLSPAQELLWQKSVPAMKYGKPARSRNPRHMKNVSRAYSRIPLSSNLESVLRSTASKNTLKVPFQTKIIDPYSHGKAALEKWGYSYDRLEASNVYFGGEKGCILYINEIEDDDNLHMPLDDEDITYRLKPRSYWHRRTILSIIGSILLTLGILFGFVIYRC